ncbi:MAG TPA: ABC transporter family substrate-binding protein [Ilumatobacteraceae bacterium]|nr:ABC transporter family substrate-binding protein [Ilumatobacteraceae bacterium]
MRTTKRGKFAAIAVGLALITAACGDDEKKSDDTTAETSGGSTETTAAAPSGGTVTYAAEQEYTAYNNGTADQVLFANTLVLNMVQPGPFISMPDLTFQLWSDMMVSAEVTSTDPQVVEYVIQPTAVWSDGEPIDCDDFYLAWIGNSGKLNHPNPDYTGEGQVDAEGNPVPAELPDFNTAGTTGYEDIGSVECSDDGKTVTVTFDKLYADWKGMFGGLIPAHVVEAKSGVADITTIDPTTSSADSVAAGEVWSTGFSGFDPEMALSGAWYTIDSWTEGQNLILKRNENFYGKPGNLDEIVFLLVPDATTQPAALENGDVQVISPQPNADLVAQLSGIAGVTTSVEQGLTFEHYDFNQANMHLAKLEVRQALAKCINREEIVDTLVKPINPDASVLNNHIYVPSAADYQDNSGGLTQDIEGAKALLESAGYTMGDDGIYVDADGNRLSIRLGRRDPNPRRQSTNELFAEQCKAAGIELTDDPAENFNAERLPAGDYDIALFAWVATPFLSSNTSIYVPGGPQNWNNYNNPELQTLFDQANAEFDDAARAELMDQIDQILWDDMATLPLFQFQEMVAYSDTVSGVVFNGPLGVTWNANEWAVTA